MSGSDQIKIKAPASPALKTPAPEMGLYLMQSLQKRGGIPAKEEFRCGIHIVRAHSGRKTGGGKKPAHPEQAYPGRGQCMERGGKGPGWAFLTRSKVGPKRDKKRLTHDQ